MPDFSEDGDIVVTKKIEAPKSVRNIQNHTSRSRIYFRFLYFFNENCFSLSLNTDNLQ